MTEEDSNQPDASAFLAHHRTKTENGPGRAEWHGGRYMLGRALRLQLSIGG
jgi:hypothetical protein